MYPLGILVYNDPAGQEHIPVDAKAFKLGRPGVVSWVDRTDAELRRDLGKNHLMRDIIDKQKEMAQISERHGDEIRRIAMNTVISGLLSVLLHL